MTDWLFDQPAEWLAQIEVAAIDAFRGYANAIGGALPDAVLVMDHFHTIGLANRAVDAVRRPTQNEALGHRGRRADPLAVPDPPRLPGGGRAVGQSGWHRLIDGLEAGDPNVRHRDESGRFGRSGALKGALAPGEGHRTSGARVYERHPELAQRRAVERDNDLDLTF